MTVLPIVQRELRVAARNPLTYRYRMTVAGLALFIIGAAGFLTAVVAPRNLGAVLFVAMSFAAWIACCMSFGLTLDCISSEKREGTLGLLFLTSLKGHDIVLGKLAASAVNACFGLLAAVPVMVLPLLLGGVSGMEALRVLLALGSMMFMSLTAGLWLSVMLRSKWGVNFCGALVAAAFFVSPMLLLVAADTWVIGELLIPLLVLHPSYAFVTAFDVIRMSQPIWAAQYPWSILATLAWGGLFLLHACRALPRKWQEHEQPVGAQTVNDPLARLLHGKAEVRAAHRRKLLSINPIYWLSMRSFVRGYEQFVFLAIGGAISIFVIADIMDEPWSGIWMAFYGLAVVKSVYAATAGGCLLPGQKEDASELLLTTPLSTLEIIRGLWRGAAEKNLALMIVAVLVCSALWWNGRWEVGATGLWDLSWLVLSVLLFADLYPLRWTAFHACVTTKKAEVQCWTAIVPIIFPPVLLTALVFVMCWALRSSTPAKAGTWFGQWVDERWLILIWLFSALVWNIILARVARLWVLEHLRTALLETRAGGKYPVPLWNWRALRDKL